MRDMTIRTVGAIVVLMGVTVAAMMQFDRGGDPSAMTLTAEDVITQSTLEKPDTSTTPAPDAFTYRVGVLAGISTPNFWTFYGQNPSVWNAYILGPTKPALYSLDGAGDLQPELATEQVSPVFNADGWRVRVDLNDNYAWSDGHSITANDFVFTFETVRSLGLGGSWADSFPATIESVHADSEYELRIEFVDRPNLTLWPHGPGFAPLMPAHIWEGQIPTDAQALYELGNVPDIAGGPLRILTASENLVVSVANRGYPSVSTPDRIEYHVFEDESAAVVALTEGTIDTVLSPKGLTASHAQELSSDPNVVVESSPANGIRYLGFNLNREPMNNLAFRTSIALLIDGEALVADINPNGASTYAFVSDANTRWFDDEVAETIGARYSQPLSIRLATALEGLRGSGYTWTSEPTIDSDGNVVAGAGLKVDGLDAAPLTILTTGDAHDPWRPQYASAIAETLGWIGFDVRPVETDFDTVVDLAFTPGEDKALHYDMYLLGWTLGSPALPSYYRTLFASGGGQNNTGYSSSTFEAQLAAYEGSFDVEGARDALWNMEMTLAADLPYLLLYSSSITEAYRADHVGYEVGLGLGGLQAQLGGINTVKPAP